MKRRPRRTLLMMGLLLLAWGAGGAIVNVAVAWISPLNGSWGKQIAPAPSNFPSRYRTLAIGWPSLSLQHEWEDGFDGPDLHRGGFFVREELLPSVSSPIYLPFRPIWPGFAINTVFYAVILWAVFAAPFALRRRRRIMRGLCPKCAYDLRGAGRGSDSAACPECGTPTATMPKP